jgi:hypothetical protein
MQIEDTGDLKNDNYLSNSKLRDENFFELYIYGDTLSFQKRYYSSATNYEKLYVDRYDLKIIKSNDTSLVVIPVSLFSKTFFQDRTILKFTKQAFAIDTSIRFDKIIFHTTECFGKCPVYHLQIENSKQLKLNAQVVYKPGSGFQRDKDLQGYFIGQLSDTTFEKLVKAIQTCNLRTLKMNSALCCDGSVNTIIVYFNGQRKYFKTMFPPTIANELIRTLYDICEEGGLTKTFDKFKIEE